MRSGAALRRSVVALLFALVALPASVSAAMPTYKGAGTFTSGTGACTAPMPVNTSATPAINDMLILVVESENEAITLSTPAGFTEFTNSPQSAGTAATNPANRIAVFWRRVVNGDTFPLTNPVAADSGDHTTCQIFAFEGSKTSGNPATDDPAGGNDGGSNDTSAVIPGTTTTTNNNLIVLVQGTSFNGTSTAQCGAATNADLANITERTDNTNTAGLGGGFCVITGQKATGGTYGTTTLTLANTSFKGAFSIPLEGSATTLYHVELQSSGAVAPNTTSVQDTRSGKANLQVGNLAVAVCGKFSPNDDAFQQSDLVNSGTATFSGTVGFKERNFNVTGTDYNAVGIWFFSVTGAGTWTPTCQGALAGSYLWIGTDEFADSSGQLAEDAGINNGADASSGNPASGSVTPSGYPALLIGGIATSTSAATAHTPDGAWSQMFESEDGANQSTGSAIYQVLTSGSDSADVTIAGTHPWVARVNTARVPSTVTAAPTLTLLGVN